MTDETAPPTPLPPAAESPYPEQEGSHPQRDEALEQLDGRAIGALGVTLIGGAVAAAVGLLVAIPLVRRARRKPAPKVARATPPARRPRRKRADA
jgi:hypothetical protein